MRRLKMLALATVALAALAMLTGGCSAFDMGDHHQQMRGGGGAPQTPVLSDASRVSIEIADYDFSPRELTVRAGTTVTWTNRDGAPHDATNAADGWGTGMLKQGESASVIFDSPRVYEYLCTIHPSMKGNLTVRENL